MLMSGLLGRRAPDLATNVATAIQARAGKTRCGIFRGTKRASTASPTSAGPPAHEVTGQPVSDRRQRRMLGGVIVHVAPIGHAFVKVVSFGLHRSFCETCGRITGHLRRIRLAVRAAHFLATSAVTADAPPFIHPTAMQTNPT